MLRSNLEESEQTILENVDKLERIRASIRQRWGANDWERRFPWWRPPALVRILVYADGLMRFAGDPFGGLQYVKTLLESRCISYVDFRVTTAHREGDSTATIKEPTNLIALDIKNNFDEVWFFGHSSNPNLTPEEVAALTDFMAPPKCGGVLVTGDHADLGRGIAGSIPRASKMRLYPAPPDRRPIWNTTLEEGSDPGCTFDSADQSDDVPQTIAFARFRAPSPIGMTRHVRPHAIFCGPDGPIDVLPDHQHEGEALAPSITIGDSEWPSKDGHQEAPIVIAKGRIKDPEATKFGQDIGLVSAYNGHEVDVGRIVADSTWHHWVDINLLGIDEFPPYAGFDATPAGRAVLKKIDHFFLNCATWLAPPDKHADMSKSAWWSILWTDQIVESSADAPLSHLGEKAISALSRRASRCAVTEFILGFPVFKEKLPRREWPHLGEHLLFLHLPIEEYVAGGILRHLMNRVGPSKANSKFPTQAPPNELLERAMIDGVDEGLLTLTSQLRQEASLALKLVGNNFRLA